MRRRLRADARTFLVDWVLHAPDAERVVIDAVLVDLRRARCLEHTRDDVSQTEYTDGSKFTTRVHLYRLTPRGLKRGLAIHLGRHIREANRVRRRGGTIDEIERALVPRELPAVASSAFASLYTGIRRR